MALCTSLSLTTAWHSAKRFSSESFKAPTCAVYDRPPVPRHARLLAGRGGERLRHLRRFVETGLVTVFDGRDYLAELGMKRAANMSRVLPAVFRSRHGAYLGRWYREHEEHHNDGVNRLVVRFAREVVETISGWRGEVNVPGLTQVRPDLLMQVSHGTLGAGTHCIVFERRAVSHREVERKLGPTAEWRRQAGPCRC